MRVLGVLGTSALFLFLMAAAPAYSQDRDDNKPQAQEAPKPQDNRAARPDNRAPQDDRARQDEKAQQQEQERQQKDQAKENKRAQQEQDRNMRDQQRDQRPVDNRPSENRQDNRRMDNRQMENRPADNRQGMGRDQNHPAAERGRHIPDDQFRTHFGREHRFHVKRDRVVNVSQPVVVYGGYSFELVDPWPADWSYDDDCYIDYVDDGYYLFDVMHPGMRIAVFVIG
jgi:hypothetical protein